MIKSFEDFQSMSKEGMEAYVASATAMTKGFQTMATEMADYSRQSFEKGTAVVEKMMAAKSFDKAVEMQQGFAKDAYDAYVSQATKMGEIYTKAAKEAYKPFEAQVAQLSPKASK